MARRGQSRPEDVLADPRGVSHPETSPASDRDADLIDGLRKGSESAFAMLVDRYYGAMLDVASMYVRRGMAEDMVQEAWLGVLKGIDRFEARSSLRTWIFRILINCAKTRGRREARSIPFSAAWDPAEDPGEPSVDPSEFFDASHPRRPHHWAAAPQSWGESPEDRALSAEGRARILQVIDGLPLSQREVIFLHDIQECTSEEVCAALGITSGNQRVLLHRARSKVREVLDHYFADGDPER
jgi:RNA polymerase sigma-70 factor, ECF subfamily